MEIENEQRSWLLEGSRQRKPKVCTEKAQV